MAAATEFMEQYDEFRTWKESSWAPWFRTADRYYYGWRDNRFWPGSKTQRASVKLRTTADFIESLVPQMMFNLFYAGGGRFFDVLSLDADKRKVRNAEDRLHFLFGAPDSKGATGLWNANHCLRAALRYGMCFGETVWSFADERPVFRYLSPRNVYWNPVTGPWIDSTGVWFKAIPHTIEEIEKYRSRNGFVIPTRAALDRLAEEYAKRQETEDVKDVMMDVNRAMGGDPPRMDRNLRVLEVVSRQTAARETWAIVGGGKATIIYDEPNPLGMLGLVGACFWPMLDAWGGEGMAKIVGVEHDLQQRLTGMAIDALDLAVTPPMGVLRNSPTNNNPGEKQWGPGVWLAGADDDNRPIQLPNVPNELLTQYGESRARAMRNAGVNDLALTGVPTPSTANRTSSGVMAQQQGSEARQFGMMAVFEEQLIVPIIMKMARLDQLFGGPRRETFDPAGNSFGVVGAGDLAPTTLVQVRAASRMMARANLLQVVPLVFQHIYNPQALAIAQQQGFGPAFEEIDALVAEAAGTSKKYQFMRPLTQEENQRIQSLSQQQQQMEAQSRQQAIQRQGEIDLILAQLREDGKADERAVKLLELLKGEASGNAPRNDADSE